MVMSVGTWVPTWVTKLRHHNGNLKPNHTLSKIASTTYDFSGNLLFPNGEPICDAKITARFGTSSVLVSKSDSTGTFSFGQIPARRMFLFDVEFGPNKHTNIGPTGGFITDESPFVIVIPQMDINF